MKPHISKAGNQWLASCDLGRGLGPDPVSAWLSMVGCVANSPDVLLFKGDPMNPKTWRFAVLPS